MKKLIRFDWAMKKLLRNKANFEILEGFLSELIRENIKINKILESESNQNSYLDKYNRVDLLVEKTGGEFIIIEVQNNSEMDYLQRILYGSSKLIVENIVKAQPYSAIKKVISVNIVYFDLGQGDDYIYKGTTNFIGIHRNDELKLSENQMKLYNTIEPYKLYPEYYIIKVNQFNDMAKDSLDEWIYFLKNEEIKDEFNAKGLKKAKEELDIMKLTVEEQREYKLHEENIRYEASMYESSYLLGEKKGVEQGKKIGIEKGEKIGIEKGEKIGIEKGEKAKAIEIARNMKNLGMDSNTIQTTTGLAKDEIDSLI